MNDERPGWPQILWTSWVVALLIAAWLALYPGWDHVGSALAKWTLKDWLDVAAAAATWAAVVVALRVSARAELKSDREKLLIARLVAAQISVQLNQFARELAALTGQLCAPDQTPADRQNNLIAVKEFVEEGAFEAFDRDTLIRLVPLPSEAAHRIARSIDLLRQAQRDLQRRRLTLEMPIARVPNAVTSLHERVRRIVVEAQLTLTVAVGECDEAAQLTQPFIPIATTRESHDG